MAILHTLRTNKILKVFTFIVVGIGMYLFVDPKFDVPLSIYYSITGQERDTGMGVDDIGSIYGTDIERATRNFSNTVINPGNFDEKLEIHNFIKQVTGFTKFNYRVDQRTPVNDNNMVWDDLITATFVDKEMKDMGLNFSELEQIDLYKGTTTGLDNIHYIFNSWWGPLGLCNKTQNPMCEDTLSSLELEEKIKNWRDDLEITISDGENNEKLNASALLSQDEVFKKYYIEEESKIQKYFSTYQQGYFMPDAIIESVNLNEQRTAEGSFIFIPFKDISSKFKYKPSEEDIVQYYSKNKYKFINEKKTRKLDYYIFNSEKDNIESKDSIYDVAREFIGSATTVNGYNDNAKNYNVRPGSVTLNSIMETSIIPNIINDSQQSRNIVRWAYGVNQDDKVIEEIKIGETYHYKMGRTQVVFCLNDINEEDYKPVEDVRTEIIKQLTNDARGKEISKFITELSDKSLDINDLANLLSVEFKNLELGTIENLNYSANKFKDRNIDDKELIGTFFGMSMNIVSNPYIGEEGVYILYKNKEGNEKKSVEQTKNTLINNSIFYQPINLRSQIISTAKEDGSVVDNRFFIY